MSQVRKVPLGDKKTFRDTSGTFFNIPVEMGRFWRSNKYKELLEVLSRNYIVSLALKQGLKIVFSGYGFKDAKLYLVNVLHGKSTYSTFIELWYVIFLLLFFQLTIFLHYSKQQKSDHWKVILLITIKEQSFNRLNSLINLSTFTG